MDEVQLALAVFLLACLVSDLPFHLSSSFLHVL
jgi:hypothetical protein